MEKVKVIRIPSRSSILVCAFAAAFATSAAAQTIIDLTATAPIPVAVRPGQQSDPHVWGSKISYSDVTNGSGEIHVFDLATGLDTAIPNSGGFDSLSDISGNNVVFTRVTNTKETIYRYDVTTQGPATELAPAPQSHRRAAAIGGNRVAWQDHGFGSTSEIVVSDLATGTVTRLTQDARTDRSVAVSPNGQVVVWVKCETETTGCKVWQAVNGSSGWTTLELVNVGSEDSLPDTNGEIVVYGRAQVLDGVLERDIYWRPVGGGPETRLALSGHDSNPNISGHLIAFERRDPATPNNSDIVVYDTQDRVLYRVTRTPTNESLNDIHYDPQSQRVTVAWTSSDEGDQNIYATVFTPRRIHPGTVPPLFAFPVAQSAEREHSARLHNYLVSYTSSPMSGIAGITRVKAFDLNCNRSLALPIVDGSHSSDSFYGHVAFVRPSSASIWTAEYVQGALTNLVRVSGVGSATTAPRGGPYVTWVEGAGAGAEVYAQDSAPSPTRITFDSNHDSAPDIGSSAIAWRSCSGANCVISVSTPTVTGWSTPTAVTTAAGYPREPVTDENWLAFTRQDSDAGNQDEVRLQALVKPFTDFGLSFTDPVTGVTELASSYFASTSNPRLAGELLAFEGRLSARRSVGDGVILNVGDSDIYVLNLRTNELFRIAFSPANEILGDLWIDEMGFGNVVYTVDTALDSNVVAVRFSLESSTPVIPYGYTLFFGPCPSFPCLVGLVPVDCGL